MSALPSLIVFSHLRWASVTQRPQHLMSRLAGRWRVLFVEEPLRCEGPARLEARSIGPELTLLLPHTPLAAPGFHDAQLALLRPLLVAQLQLRGVRADMAWLTTPMALPLAQAVRPHCLAYDCMDELTAFKDAPHQLRQRETALLAQAALVLTAGPSLYESRRERHGQVHCFPSAVDAAHFAPSGLRPGSVHDLAARAQQDLLPQPRLGYFGGIDERLDIGLLALLADRHPEWSLVMVGPVSHTDAAALPRRPNIHWLGRQPYERLPYLLAGWDLCLVPFALNPRTHFICPTKTLEYMAGDKPVVSTPLRDVVAMYGEAVAVAPSGDPFVQTCEAVLAERGAARCRRAMEMLNTVSMHSWDRSAKAVHELLARALAQARAAQAGPARVASAGG